VELEWQGEGREEKGIDPKTGRVRVAVDPNYFRPAEVDLLVGDASKARTVLGWEPKTTLPELVHLMVQADLEKVKRRGY